ncbi:MAG: hypothetical protein J6R84_05295 [Alistipes sp.]|nr:hypothetical protein [Alistipes sp.]MBO5983405.1 hypothetical protein [Rikenellaceae bacterium]
MWKRVVSLVLATLCLAFVAGCNDEEVDVAESQRSAIVNYLTSSHSPRLIDIRDVPNSMEAKPAFYERLEYNTYRYIASYYDQGREAKRMVRAGDEVSLTYIAFRFTGGQPSLANVYATNDASTLAELRKAGLNTEFWPAEPLKVKIGQTKIIKGVPLSLVGCREGDVVEAYMTLDAAYGNDVIGVAGDESAIAWFYSIDSVVGE